MFDTVWAPFGNPRINRNMQQGFVRESMCIVDGRRGLADGLPPSALLGRSVSGLAGRKLRFRPQLFWQEVLPEHAASSSLQFHCDLSSGRNFARVPSDAEYSADGSHARAQARAVDDAEAEPSEVEAVGRALREAATFEDVLPLQHLLLSCYATVRALEGALCEACRRGHAAAAELLLRAGADPRAQPDGKSALSCACGEGHEEVARLLLSADAELLELPDAAGGRSPLEAARDADLGAMARRLEALARELRSAS